MERLRQRKDFLAAAGGAHASTAGFVLQQRRREDGGPPRVGFTVSKKVGGAVARNRVRRQLREIVRLCDTLQAGNDYVVVGRGAALGIPFARMAEDFTGALRRLERGRRGSPGTTGGKVKGPDARDRSTGDQSAS